MENIIILLQNKIKIGALAARVRRSPFSLTEMLRIIAQRISLLFQPVEDDNDNSDGEKC